MSKAFDEWSKEVPRIMSDELREEEDAIRLTGWNAAIEAAAKLLEAKAAELSVPDLTTGAKWVRELAEEK